MQDVGAVRQNYYSKQGAPMRNPSLEVSHPHLILSSASPPHPHLLILTSSSPHHPQNHHLILSQDIHGWVSEHSLYKETLARENIREIMQILSFDGMVEKTERANGKLSSHPLISSLPPPHLILAYSSPHPHLIITSSSPHNPHPHPTLA